MSRWLRSALAIIVGFVGATAALVAIEDGEPGEARYLGTLEVLDFCRVEHGPAAAAVVLGRNAWAWNCTFVNNGLFKQEGVDFDRACRVQHDESEAFGTPLDENDPYSWECFSRA